MKRLTRTALLVALAWLGSAASAGAFCRTRTCDRTDAEQECEVDDEDCVTTGFELFWASDCVTFAVQRDGSVDQNIDADTLEDITRRAFSHWLDADCDGDHPSLRVGSLGKVECNVSRYNENGRNANVVMFRDGTWPYGNAIDAYGITRVRFDTTTGEIYDADVEINSAEYAIASSTGREGADLESILTHEFGHFLGLSHAAPDDEEATMKAGWDGEGTAIRSLARDDEEGICVAYPPDRTLATDSCEPRQGFASACDVPRPAADEAQGCTLAGGRARGGSSALVGALLFGLAALGRAARRSKRQR